MDEQEQTKSLIHINDSPQIYMEHDVIFRRLEIGYANDIIVELYVQECYEKSMKTMNDCKHILLIFFVYDE